MRGEGLAGVWFLGFGIMGGGGCLGRGGGACFLMILSRMLLSFMAERKMSWALQQTEKKYIHTKTDRYH